MITNHWLLTISYRRDLQDLTTSSLVGNWIAFDVINAEFTFGISVEVITRLDHMSFLPFINNTDKFWRNGTALREISRPCFCCGERWSICHHFLHITSRNQELQNWSRSVGNRDGFLSDIWMFELLWEKKHWPVRQLYIR